MSNGSPSVGEMRLVRQIVREHKKQITHISAMAKAQTLLDRAAKLVAEARKLLSEGQVW